eukprot:TRINITY_DN180_c0_g1_i1.p1 TRINITY_DN180_c0_g1~~TRINITY_DN180_c0_g1_i1.p1  ORF type:complete len:142 (-),score=17.97 TRINITY_DN180_c0_g1_i1:77-478(-)
MFFSRLVLALVLVALAIALPSASPQEQAFSLDITFENFSGQTMQLTSMDYNGVVVRPAAVVATDESTSMKVIRETAGASGGTVYYGINQGGFEASWNLHPQGLAILTAITSPEFGVGIVYNSFTNVTLSVYSK